MLISIVIVVFFAAGQLSPAGSTPLQVPFTAAIFAAFNAAISLTAYYLARKKISFYMALTAYMSTFITICVLVLLTGGAWSPFVALWLLIGVFSGVFGWWALIGLAIVANGYLVYQLFLSGRALGIDRIVQLLMLIEAPLIASYIMWHSRSKNDLAKDGDQVDELKTQLSAMSTKSDIVINAIADGVVAIDQTGLIQLINPAAQTLLGWPGKDAIGLDYRSVVKLADTKGNPVPEDFSPIRQVLMTHKEITNNDLELKTKSGKVVLISLVVSPVGDSSSNNGAIAVFRDITREKEEERQKAEFISTASHEMRTPVAAIEGYLGLAMNPATATIDDKARSYLQKAHESTQHLGRLFQDLLTVSKSEDARLIPRPVVIDVIALTREIVASLQPKAKSKGIFLSFAPGEADSEGNKHITPVYYTYADQDQMREVLNNLVDNAVKYTKQGTATVDVTGTNEVVTVNVTDSGIGIPPEDVPHLFQKFYRVDNSDTREIGGTGLGLYISRRLIEANNGHIGVSSTYGKGSTFYVQLPRISHDQATAIMNAPQPTATAPAAQHAAPQTPPTQPAPPATPTPTPPVATPPAVPGQPQAV